jgi:hypothetical protein
LLEKLAKLKGDSHGKGGLEGFLGGLFHQWVKHPWILEVLPVRLILSGLSWN